MDKRIMKVITLILSCLLLIGAAVGITVAAEDVAPAPTVEIAKKNIAYEGAIQMVYLVDANNLQDGQTVAISFNDGEYVKKPAGEIDLGGKTYKAVYSNGIVAKDYRKALEATPVVLDAEGNTVAEGAAVTFTAYDYAMTRFDGESISGAQRNLYKALLDYSAAVQAVLGYTDETIAEVGGWADEYYKLTVDDGEAQSLRGKNFDGILTADRFIEDGAKGFTGWTDGEGNTVVGWTTLKVLPGTTVVKRNYADNNSALQTLDGLTELPANATATLLNEDSFATVADNVVSFGHLQSISDGSSLKFAPATPGVYAREYVFEADFNWKEVTQTKNTWVYKICLYNGTTELFNMTLNPKTVGYEAGGVICDFDTWHHLKLAVSIADDGTVCTSTNVDGYEVNGVNVQYFKPDVTTNDYKMVSAGVGMRDSSYHDCTDTYLLFDNVAVYTVGAPVSYELPLDANGGTVDPYTVTMGEAYELPTPIGETPFIGWYLGETLVPQTGTWTYVGYDSETKAYGKAPTLTARWSAPVAITLNANGGVCDAESMTVYQGQDYELPTVTRSGLIFGGWFDAEGKFIAPNGTWPAGGDETVVLTARWYVATNGTANNYDSGSVVNGALNGASYADGKVTATAPGWSTGTYFNIGSGGTVCSGNTEGSKYVFETEFTYTGNAPASQTQLAFVGFTNTTTFSNEHMAYNEYLSSSSDSDSDGYADSLYLYGVQFPVGVTKNIRYEFIVGTGEVQVYVEGEFSHSYTLNRQATHIANNKLDVTNVCRFMFVWRTPSTGTKVTFDNTYVGIESISAESTFTLDPTYGTLAEEDNKTYTYMTGEEYTLPTPTLDGFAFTGWGYGNIIIPTSGKWAASLPEGAVLEANWVLTSAHSTDFSDGTQPSWIAGGGLTVSDGALHAIYSSSGIQFKPVATVTGAGVGTKYVFQMDFTFGGIDTGSDNALAFMGFSHTSATWQQGTHKWGYLQASSDGATATLYGNSFPKDVTKTIRFEFTVTGANTGDLEIFVNGSKGTVSATTITGLSTGDFHQFNIQWRGAAANRNLSCTIDNVYVGVNYPVEEATYTLNANGGTLPEGTETGVTTLVGSSYTLPIPKVTDEYEFLGWYNGDTLVPNEGQWTAKGNSNLVAKYSEKAVTSYSDFTKDSRTGWSAGLKWTIGSATSAADVGNTVYIFSTKYTYHGLTNFKITDGVVSVQTSQNYGFPRLYDSDGTTEFIAFDGTVKPSGTYVNAEGEAVVDANKNLIDTSITDPTQIFHENLVWWGLTFKINETYDIAVTATIVDGDKTVVKVTATDSKGNVQSATPTASGTAKHTNITKFVMETRSPDSGTTYKLTQSFEKTSFKVLKPFNGTLTAEDDYADVSGNKADPRIVKPGYNENMVDETGSKFIIDMNYKFQGLGGVFTIDPETYAVTSCYVSNAVIAYMGFYNNNAIGDRLRYSECKLASGAQIVNAAGDVVVDENNVLLEQYRGELTAADLFYNKVTWCGITFVVGETYKIHMSYTTGTTTYENGIINAANGTAAISATDSKGNVQKGSMGAGASGDCDYMHNVQAFSFYCRSDSNMTGDANIKYTFYHTFSDIVVTTTAPTEQIETTGTIYGVKLFNKNPSASAYVFVSVDSGVAYTLPTPTYEGYTFAGWVECNYKGTVTGTEIIPATGETWPFEKDVCLAATWEAVAEATEE